MKAAILKSSPRYQSWLDVFGTDEVEVLDPVPVVEGGRAQIPPASYRRGYFYRLDVAALNPGQRVRLIRCLSARWKIPVDTIERLIDDPAHGVPVLADDVVVEMGLFL